MRSRHCPAVFPGIEPPLELWRQALREYFPVTTGSVSALVAAFFWNGPSSLILPPSLIGSSGDNNRGVDIDFDES